MKAAIERSPTGSARVSSPVFSLLGCDNALVDPYFSQQAPLLYDFLPSSSCWVPPLFSHPPGDFKEPPAVSPFLHSLLPSFYPHNTFGVSKIQTNPSGNHQRRPLVTCCECSLPILCHRQGSLLSAGKGSPRVLCLRAPLLWGGSRVTIQTPPCSVACRQGGQGEHECH